MFKNTEISSRGVSAYLLKKFGARYRVLLLRRARYLKGEWCQVAGNCEGTEKAWQAILREIKEETGLVPEALYSANACEQFYEPNRDSIWIAPIFVAFIPAEQEVVLNEEHTEFRWVSFRQAARMVTFRQQREVLAIVKREYADRPPLRWLAIDTSAG